MPTSARTSRSRRTASTPWTRSAPSTLVNAAGLPTPTQRPVGRRRAAARLARPGRSAAGRHGRPDAQARAARPASCSTRRRARHPVEFGRRLVDAARRAVTAGVIATFDDGSRGHGRPARRRRWDPLGHAPPDRSDGAPSGRYVGLTNFGGITRGGRARRRARGVAHDLRPAGVLRLPRHARRRRRLVRRTGRATEIEPRGARRDRRRRLEGAAHRAVRR